MTALSANLESIEYQSAVCALGCLAVAIVLASLAVYRRVRKRVDRRQAWVRSSWDVLLLCVLGIASVLFLIRSWRHTWDRQAQLSLLAAALTVYYQQYDVLPQNLEAVAATRLLGITSCKPIQGDYLEVNGVRVRYLQATKPGFIVVVEAGPCWKRGYVILGDTSSHYANETELQRVLAHDEQQRRAAGQPQGWGKR